MHGFLLLLVYRIAKLVLFCDFPHHFTWYANCDYIAWYGFCHHAPGSDDGIVPNGYAGQNGCSSSNPNIISHNDRLCNFHTCLTLLRVNGMFGCGKAAVGSDKNMIPKGYFCPVRNDEIVIGIKPIAHRNIVAVITPKGRGNGYIFPHFA